MKTTKVSISLAALAMAMLLGSCAGNDGNSKVLTGSAGASSQEAPQPTTTEPGPTLPPPPKNMDEAFGVDSGDRVPVGPTDGSDRIGWVNWADLPGRNAETAPVVPVYAERGPSSDEGSVIAYWGNGLGWIEVADYESPDFNYEQRRAERAEQNKADAEEMQSHDGN